jgi:hypothetical protein
MNSGHRQGAMCDDFKSRLCGLSLAMMLADAPRQRELAGPRPTAAWRTPQRPFHLTKEQVYTLGISDPRYERR